MHCVGGAVGGRSAGSLGWLHGLVVGFIYYLAVMVLLTVWSTGFPVFSVWFAHGLVVVILSAIGGIIGVNMPGARRGIKVNRSSRKRFPV